MSSSQPTVDILLATYNGERYLREQIESIRYQTYEQWRLLISDDCSSDNTPSIIRSYAETDPRITLISESERFGNARDNFFNLLRHSTSSFAMFCDQDDVWLEDKIEVSLKEMRRVSSEVSADLPIVVFTDSVVVDENLEVLSNSYQRFTNHYPHHTEPRRLLVTNTAPGNAMILNQPLVRLLQEIEQTSEIVMHDWFAMLLASAFGKIAYVPTPTLLYRQHRNNVVGAVKRTLISKIANRLGPENDSEMTARLKVENESAVQAAFFANTYASKLTKKQYRQASEYAKAITTDRFHSAVMSLVKSGCWKPGPTQKVGQIIHRYEACRSNNTSQRES